MTTSAFIITRDASVSAAETGKVGFFACADRVRFAMGWSADPWHDFELIDISGKMVFAGKSRLCGDTFPLRFLINNGFAVDAVAINYPKSR